MPGSPENLASVRASRRKRSRPFSKKARRSSVVLLLTLGEMVLLRLTKPLG